MFQKVKEAVTGARLRAGQIWREHRERAEERKAENAEQPGVTIPRWLIRSVDIAGWMAYAILVWFILQRVLSIAESRFETLTFTHFGPWSDLVFNWHFPLVIGYIGAAIAVPFIAKFVIPLLVSLSWRTHFWAKSWALLITVMVSFVLITGTMKVGGDAIIESERGSAVAVATIEQQRTGINSQIARKERELQALINHPNTYFSIAAGMSPEAYRRNYIEARRNDPNIERLRSALGASEDAARLRTEIAELEDQRDTMQTTAAVSSTVESERTGEIQSLIDRLNVWWLLAFAAILDICCLLLPWLKLTLQNIRARQLGMAEGIPRHSYMLSDERKSPNHASFKDPARRSAQDVVDAMIAGGADPRFAADMARSAARSSVADEIALDEDGTPLTEVRYYKRADGKPLVKNQKNRVIVPPGPPLPEETGVTHDGGGRVGSVVAGAASVSVGGDELAALNPLDNVSGGLVGGDNEADDKAEKSAAADQQEAIQNEPSLEDLPELTEEQAAALMAAADEITEAVTVDAPPATLTVEESLPADDDQAEQSDATPADQNDTPITDERRMIAAYAAE